MAQKNTFPKDTTKEIILGDLSSARSTRKLDEEVQFAKLPKKTCIWSTKTKILVAIGVLLIVAAGLGVGLYFRFRDRLEPTSPINKVSLGNGEYVALGEFELEERNLFSKDVSQKILLTQAIRKKATQSSRLLQEEQENEEIVDYSATVNLEEVGFEVTYNSENQLGVQVESEKLFDYLMATQPNAARLLAEVMEIQNADEAASVQQLEKQMSELFNEELGMFGSFEFHETPIVELKLNTTSSNYEIMDEKGVPIKDARRLLMIRILFFKQLFEGIKRVVQAVVKPVVQFVRNHGSTIGKVAGGIIGFIAGGPVGAKLGMKIGEGIGLAAQTFVKACVPQNVLTIRCTGDSIKSAGIDLAKDLGKKVLSSVGSSIWNSFSK